MKKPHAIMVCAHLQGHINPFINLATKLASKGFSITFALLESTHHRISKSQHINSGGGDIFAAARSSGLDIRCTTFSDGLPLDFDRANVDYLKSFLHRFIDSVDEVVGKILQSDSSSSFNYFLITDTMSAWWKKIAEKYGLMSVSLWTQAALVFTLLYHWELMREKGHVPVNGRREIVDYLPGIKPINTKDFMSQLLDDGYHPQHALTFEAFVAVKSADFVLCNTVRELEAETVSALQQQQPFYSVGPLFSSNISSVPKSLLPETETADWLNSRQPGSVLYVSFGSSIKTDRNVIAAIAGGLIMSEQVSFVWVIRPGLVVDSSGGVLPEGFEDRTRNRGLVVPWCSQSEVLQNPAIGGFLTHCGWNSVLESVGCGVPMICYPFRGDQIMNRKLVVDDWRVGINLCNCESISKEEVAEKMEVLMNEKSSRDLRHEIQKMKRTFQDAISVGGSSENNFDRFVEDVSRELLKRLMPLNDRFSY